VCGVCMCVCGGGVWTGDGADFKVGVSPYQSLWVVEGVALVKQVRLLCHTGRGGAGEWVHGAADVAPRC
jgi:hypothetical protein